MNDSLQSQLIEQILLLFPKKAEAVEKLSDLLNLGRDAVYRRLRGDTMLTPDEVSLLARSFGISLDSLIFGDTDSVFFTFNAFSREINSLEDYLAGLHQNLAQLGSLKNVQLFYASSEMPVFHYFFYPELISFKLFVWGQTVWNLDYLQHQAFRFDLIPPHVIQMGEEILHMYNNLNTTELWSLNIFDNTLNQIAYHAKSGSFARSEDALLLCDCLDRLAGHLCSMAEHGRKFRLNQSPDSGRPFNLYHNEMIYTNNTLLLRAARQRVVFSTFGDPNFLSSTDRRICDFTEDWFRKIISKSTAISNHSEASRNSFFNGLRRRVDHSRKRIEMQLEGPL